MPFRDVVGHRRLTGLLARAAARGTLPPTLLFAGPSGVGKWRVALATAQAVNCLEPVRNDASDGSANGGWAIDACGTCRSCERIARGVHVDVIAVESDERASIKIDVIRDVLGHAGYRPFEGQRRVILIREADALETGAQNALLKSLEEPPPGTMFILTTPVPGALVSTVRSRCMRLTFGRITVADITRALVRDHGWSQAAAAGAAPLADGSIGQALALADQNLTVVRDVAMRLLQQTAGRADMQARVSAGTALVVVRPKVERTRAEVSAILRVAASILRDIEAINSGADRRVLAHPGADDVMALAGAFSGERARAAFGAVDHALMALGRNAGTKVVAEWLAVQI